MGTFGGSDIKEEANRYFFFITNNFSLFDVKGQGRFWNFRVKRFGGWSE